VDDHCASTTQNPSPACKRAGYGISRTAPNPPTFVPFFGEVSCYLNADGQPISLLEKAIADAGINSSVAEFSSQLLIQGDILTALAPVLFPAPIRF
jgi:hypothetical protein